MNIEHGLSVLNPRPVRIEGPRLLHHLVRNEGSTQAPAIDFLGGNGSIRTLSYEDLQNRSDRLAHRLLSVRKTFDGPGSKPLIVPVLIPQSPDLYITILAILKTGGAFCPLTPRMPEERLRFVLQDVSAELLVTTTAFHALLPEKLPVVVVVADEDDDDSVHRISCNTDDDSSRLAYVMYTSGSTGTPKGVCISHSAATQALLAHDRHIPKFSRFLQFASPTFDVSVFEIFFPLFRGATLVCCDRGRLLSDLPGVISTLNVDAAELTPSVASSLLQGRASVPSLKVLLTIGEMLNRQIVEDFGGSSTETGILHGMYGPTEASIHCTLQTGFAKDMPVGNIGVPLDTVSALILRAQSPDGGCLSGPEVVPVGQVGELAVGGYQLAEGYLNRDEQTKSAFFKHPQYGRLYRTGDKARMVAPGKLECLGRISTGQIKLRGMRMELGEIEQVASRTLGCKGTVAAAISGNLVLFCLAEPDKLTEEQVRQMCCKWLPAAMMPSTIIISQQFPYLPSGKVDRRRLESNFHDDLNQRIVQPAAQTHEVRSLAHIISNVLGTKIGAETNFTAAGLDSLSSIRLARKLRESGYPQLDASIIQQSRSVEVLQRELMQARRLSDVSEHDGDDVFNDLVMAAMNEPYLIACSSEIDRVFGCTTMQAAMLAETARDDQAYCNWTELEVLDTSTADVADRLRELSERHEMLRAGFVVMQQTSFSHAVVIWKALSPDQVSVVDEFDYEFHMDHSRQLFRPFSVQLRGSGGSVRVLIKLHHALYDQWSMEILMRDLDGLLSRQKLREKSSFVDVALYHARHNRHLTLKDRSVDFWRTYMHGSAPSALPNLNDRIVSAGTGRTLSQTLAIDVPALRQASRQLMCSPPVFFQAALALVLCSYVGVTDVTYGTVVSGRQIPVDGIDDVFGACLNTLPMRVDISGSRTCKDLIRTVQSCNNDILKHSLTSLAEIKRSAESASELRLFDTLFVWQETSHKKDKLRDRVKHVSSSDHLDFSLTLELEPFGEEFRGKVTYQRSMLPHTQAILILEQLSHYVNYLCASPTALLVDINDEMPISALSISNMDPEIHDTEPGLVAVIENQAQRSPNATAIIFALDLFDSVASTYSVTYRELNEQANRIAHRLLSSGVRPDELVCICMEKSPELYISVLAVTKAGAGYLAVTPDTPLSRVQAILSEAQAKICLCDTGSVEMLQNIDGLILTDVMQGGFSKESAHNPQTPYNEAHLAYAVFTSGSTGLPKGVLITKENLLSNIIALSEVYPVQPGDRMLQACSQAFDVSVFEIFFAFYQGISLCAATKDTLFHDIEAAIRLLRVTHLSLTPTVASLIDPANLPTVRFLVTAGEAVTSTVQKKWAGHGLYQGYGPSETTNICTVNRRVSPDDFLSNVGPPLGNTSAFVLSLGKEFEVSPAGAIGELAFGGQQVFRGYLNRDELNSSTVVHHAKYGRIYRSGDLGRILSNHTIQISGRVDEQVKVRGNRIELGEINNVILGHPQTSDCTTIVLGDKRERLVSFWVPSHVRQADDFRVCEQSELARAAISELSQSLQDKLPGYMLPSNLVPVTQLPMTTQGKLDKRRLAATFHALDQSARDTSIARGIGQDENDWSTIERSLANALAEVLGIPLARVGKHAPFSSFGLDSIKAIRYARILEDRLNRRVAVSEILKHSSVSRLGIVFVAGNTSDAGKVVDLSCIFSQEFKDRVKSDFFHLDKHVVKILPCTPLQEAMLSSTAAKDSTAYKNIITFDVTADIARLKRCWSDMVARHDILRTYFVTTNNTRYPYAQVVVDQAKLPWQEFHNKSVDEVVLELRNASIRLLSLESLPFSISTLVAGYSTYLVLQIHHSLYDGIAMSNLLTEVEASYSGRPLHKAASMEAFLEVTHSAWDDDSSAFWLEVLKSFKPRPFKRRHHAGAAVPNVIHREITTQLATAEDTCRRHAVSLLSICQAAWAKVLSICVQSADVCFGNVVSGRSLPVLGIDRLVGPCFNSLPVRATLDTLYSNLDLMRKLNTHNVVAMEHQLTPLRQISSLMRRWSGHLFDSLVLLQPPPVPLDSDIWVLKAEEGSMGVPLILELLPCDDTLKVSLHFDRSFVTAEGAEVLIEAFDVAFLSCARYTSSDVSDFLSFDINRLAAIIEYTTSIPADDSELFSSSSTSEPWSVLEMDVRQAFATLSGATIERIGKDTSMYRLGLDSLNSVQVAALLKEQGFDISAADVMENPTCSGLAAIAHNREGSKNAPCPPEFDFEVFDTQLRQSLCDTACLDPICIEALRPCTPTQIGMLSQSLRSDEARYNYINHITYEVPQNVSDAAIFKAWKAVQAKHQNLRMGFASIEDVQHPFVMIIYKPSAARVPCSRAKDDLHTRMARQEILGELHRPAWRISVLESNGKRSMTVLLHHALYDAESLRIIFADLQASLQSSSLGSARTIDTTLTAILSSAADAEGSHSEFWRDHLQHASITRFPSLTPTVAKDSSLVTITHRSIIAKSNLELQCRRRGLTIQALGQYVWAHILAAYTGESIVTFGVVLSGRTAHGSQNLAFPCISTVPLVCQTAVNCRTQLESLMSFNASVQRHQFLPLTEIHRCAENNNRSLFDTLFVYQKPLGNSNTEFDWRLISENSSVNYQVSLELECATDAVDLRLTVRTNLVPEEHAQILIRQYEALLYRELEPDVEAVNYSDPRLYSIIPAREAMIPSTAMLLHHFVELKAQETPRRIALSFVNDLQQGKLSQKSWTYEQLDLQGNRIAHLIQQQGVYAGGIVVVCLDKCAEASFAFVGILKAGCAFLAMDPALPEARKTFILRDSGAKLLLTTSKHLSSTGDSVNVPYIALDKVEYAELSSKALVISTEPSATSYVLYTSGTTGTPKGCEISHENTVQAMLAFQRLFAGHWTIESRWLQFASYWFDVSVLEQFWSWSVGICVVAAPRDLVLEDLAYFIRTLNITHLDLTPSLARLLHPDDVPSLCDGVFITGGEALKQEILDVWGSKNVICNGYGPTEATIGVTMYPYVGPDVKPSNIGWQFDNVGTYVLQPGTDVPVLHGGVGELCVSGSLVGKGYLNRSDLTGQQFPSLDRFGERVYRTGDLVRLLHDDSFLYLGRQDSQSKLRGQRLELEEIDAVIKDSSEYIEDVTSIVVKSLRQQKELLVSFMLCKPTTHKSEPRVLICNDDKLLIQRARSACEDRLPGYMVPTHILPVTAMPLSVNNKIDTKRLLAIYEELPASMLHALTNGGADKQDLSALECKIRDVLSRTVKDVPEDVHTGTNTFTAGLDSVSAVVFAKGLRTAGFDQATVNVVMIHPTIGSLARALSKRSSSQDGNVQSAVMSIAAYGQRYRQLAVERLQTPESTLEAIAPCTPLQQGLIYESLRFETGPYFNEFRFELGDTDLLRVKQAFQSLVDHTQILRTKFLATDEGYIQVVERSSELQWSEINSGKGVLETTLAATKQTWSRNNAWDLLHPFEVVIAHCLSTSVMSVHIHHALYDGIAWDLLMARLSETYMNGKTTLSGPSFIDSLPYGPLQHHEEAKGFWTEELASVVPVTFPRLIADPAMGDSVVTRVLRGCAGLEDTRKVLGVSHQAIIQACWLVTLQEFAPEVQIIGLVVSGRSIDFDDASSVIGPLFNTVPFVGRPSIDDSWADLIEYCQQFNNRALPYQHTPLRDVLRWCGPGPSQPLFDTIFVFQREAGPTAKATQNPWHSINNPTDAEFPVAFEAKLASSGYLEVTIAAQRHIADDMLLQHIGTRFEMAINAAISEPASKISQMSAVIMPGKRQPALPNRYDIVDTKRIHEFHWTSAASMIRTEVARLAETDISKVDEHISIFSLGLDSIDAVKLSSRFKRAGLKIPVSAIMRAQTISRMLDASETVDRGNSANGKSIHLHEIEQELSRSLDSIMKSPEVERILPATPSQEALIADMINSNFTEYYNHDVLQLAPDVDIERLEAAWQSIISASPILRTSFHEVEDPNFDTVFVQVVRRPGPVTFDRVTIERDTDLKDLLIDIRNAVRSSFMSKPPLRLTFAGCSEQSFLVLSLAHAQYDGYSLALLHDDAHRAYDGYVPTRPDYEGVIETALSGISYQAEQYWRGALRRSTIQRFPRRSGILSGSIPTTHRAEKRSEVSASRAQAFCRKHGVTMQALGQTSWALVLAHYQQALDVLFGVVLGCRDSDEAQQTMFPTMNTVVMRAILHGTRSGMVQHIQGVIGDMMSFQHTPLRKIKAWRAHEVQAQEENSEPKSGHLGLFDTLFIYQQRPEPSHDSTERLYHSVSGASEVEYSVAAEMEISGKDLIFRTACKSDVLDSRGASTLLRRLDGVLHAIINTPAQPTVIFVNGQTRICGMASFFRRDLDSLNMKTAEFKEEAVAKEPDEWSALEHTLRQVLAKVSRMPETAISKTAKIETIGIDSISAIKVAALLRKHSVLLKVSDVLRARTVAEMAKLVSKPEDGADQSGAQAGSIVTEYVRRHGLDSVPVGPVVEDCNVETILPANAGQVYMLSAWMSSAGHLLYPTFTYRLRANLEMAKIRDAWRRVVRHNPILRTVFYATGNAHMPAIQAVLKEAPESFREGSYSVLTTTGPLLKQPFASMTATASPDGFVLQLHIHHALYDAVSLPLLMQSFFAELTGTAPISTMSASTAFTALGLTKQSRDSRKAFWEQYLAAVEPSRMKQPTTKRAQRRVELFEPGAFARYDKLVQIARAAGVTLQAILFASIAKLHACQAAGACDNNSDDEGRVHNGDIVLGIYLSNRSLLEHLDTLTAPTLNLVPLVVRSTHSTPLQDLAQQVQADLRNIGTAENSVVGLWEIYEWTGIKVDVFVNFLKLPDSDEERVLHAQSDFVLDEVTNRRTTQCATVTSPLDGVFSLPKELKGDFLNDAYLSLDIEVAVRDGALDIGLFCPEAMLSLEEAQQAVQDLSDTLEELIVED